ncbi:hypothetical protein CR513_52732, partial [Mucuna pruriens]
MVAKLYGICTFVEHPTDMCPTLQETEADQPENVDSNMGSNHIRCGLLITSSMEDNHFSQVRNKDRTQLREPNMCRVCLKDQQVTNSQAHNIRHHLSNSKSNREYLLKLVTSNLEFQQSVSSNNMQFQQNVTATIQDLKMQIGQLANTSVGLSNLPSQTIPNPRGNASVVTLRSGKELPQPILQQLPRSAEVDSEPNPNSRSRPETTVPFPFPSRQGSESQMKNC